MKIILAVTLTVLFASIPAARAAVPCDPNEERTAVLAFALVGDDALLQACADRGVDAKKVSALNKAGVKNGDELVLAQSRAALEAIKRSGVHAFDKFLTDERDEKSVPARAESRDDGDDRVARHPGKQNI